jgi:hypothetical protein
VVKEEVKKKETETDSEDEEEVINEEDKDKMEDGNFKDKNESPDPQIPRSYTLSPTKFGQKVMYI